MKAYFFRFLDAELVFTGWLGLAIGEDHAAIREQIDSHGDIEAAQVMQATRPASFAVLYTPTGDGPNEVAESETSGWEFPYSDKGWSRPDWLAGVPF
jgi:hypothetical protein